MSRELDKAIAEALGWERYEGLWRDPKKELEISWPDYSSNGNAMLELDREMRERGWLLGLYCDGGLDYAANYNNSKRNKETGWWLAAVIEDTQIADTIPEVVALAAYKALTGKDWEGEGE